MSGRYVAEFKQQLNGGYLYFILLLQFIISVLYTSLLRQYMDDYLHTLS